MRVLNNVETANTYPQEGGGGSQLIQGPCILAELDVFNNAAFIQLLTSESGEAGQAVWGPELFVSPQHRTFWRRAIFGIRARSAAEGKAAQVAFGLVSEDETHIGHALALLDGMDRMTAQLELMNRNLDAVLTHQHAPPLARGDGTHQ